MNIALRLADYEKEISEAKRGGVLSFLRIGKALHAINQGDLWQGQASSFSSYVENSLGLKRSWAYSLINVWQVWGQQLLAAPDLQSVEITRLVKLLPLTTDENKEELLHAAAHIPDVRGFENNLKNLRGKKGTDECDHNFQVVSFWQCELCGLRKKTEDK
uniref:Uncharacterized protein n=1 Tax=viral metagenome TaxID=1070528 RepID=A0A6M3LS74_9ZZZZ